ncbi:hypothetical protein P154DRAFT_342956 [Amniculicola lignicola CBS 123094]|uniref:Uncharacterized protein n=1 Tax=Amniculicola lignicola CBS 123094 TaxID=1392246 RepID=A0A6A5W3M2_9PLEO|nr:hypothetical protein P154DRAFT_342956 [Amniculicola lignicola CBS 123094]
MGAGTIMLATGEVGMVHDSTVTPKALLNDHLRQSTAKSNSSNSCKHYRSRPARASRQSCAPPFAHPHHWGLCGLCLDGLRFVDGLCFDGPLSLCPCLDGLCLHLCHCLFLDLSIAHVCNLGFWFSIGWRICRCSALALPATCAFAFCLSPVFLLFPLTLGDEVFVFHEPLCAARTKPSTLKIEQDRCLIRRQAMLQSLNVKITFTLMPPRLIYKGSSTWRK